ncbi:MAG: small GTPase RAS2 [Olpidium bornovanus]|uniref:Small GTPase RAS2 n=1 Tax=Olpidium bornovanus TaxID=278681 RepID=A0A8H8A0G4_9FUNG|nr:MAG: small GTPase RAS2 [Olpidium bornovanus]
MVKIIRDKILNYMGTDYAPMVIVGNKVDLETQRQVSFQEAQELATKYNCVAVETSAKNNDNIGKVFDCIIAQIEKDTSGGAAEEKKPCVVM